MNGCVSNGEVAFARTNSISALSNRRAKPEIVAYRRALSLPKELRLEETPAKGTTGDR